MKIKSAHDLLIDQLRDLYDVETQVSGTMPELAAQSPDPALRDFLAVQHEASLRQKRRLEEASVAVESTLEGDTCKAMQGLIEGGDQHIAKAEGDLVMSLILIAHVNRILHYQVAGYDVANALAKRRGLSEVDSLLANSLQEERRAARELAGLSLKIFGQVEGAP